MIDSYGIYFYIIRIFIFYDLKIVLANDLSSLSSKSDIDSSFMSTAFNSGNCSIKQSKNLYF